MTQPIVFVKSTTNFWTSKTVRLTSASGIHASKLGVCGLGVLVDHHVHSFLDVLVERSSVKTTNVLNFLQTGMIIIFICTMGHVSCPHVTIAPGQFVAAYSHCTPI